MVLSREITHYKRFPTEFASMDHKQCPESRLDMKDNRKCITISLSTSTISKNLKNFKKSTMTKSHCFVGNEANSGSVCLVQMSLLIFVPDEFETVSKFA